jgi:hypothetical protein
MDLDNLVFSRAEELVTRRIAGETLVVPVRGRVGDLDSVFTLDDVASRVWELVDGRTSAGAIARAVAREYDVEAVRAAGDVAELLAEMEEAGLVRAGGE